MKIEVNLEQLIDDILNSKTLEEAKIYAKVIKKGIQVTCVTAKFVKRPDHFIEMIKKVRDYTGWGLKESKEFVDGTSTVQLEQGLFRVLETEAMRDNGVIKDITPNSIKFMVGD